MPAWEAPERISRLLQAAFGPLQGVEDLTICIISIASSITLGGSIVENLI
jgi:hypothetical protein